MKLVCERLIAGIVSKPFYVPPIHSKLTRGSRSRDFTMGGPLTYYTRARGMTLRKLLSTEIRASVKMRFER